MPTLPLGNPICTNPLGLPLQAEVRAAYWPSSLHIGASITGACSLPHQTHPEGVCVEAQ